jgi:hypothetical protein
VEALVWTGLILGLLFTMGNVQKFASNGAEPGSTEWIISWLLDPMVSLVLIAILLAEAVTSRWQIRTGGWVRTAKWALLAATGAMNTWESVKGGAPSEVLQHTVPVAVVFLTAEAITDLREHLTEAVHKAYAAATERARSMAQEPFMNAAPTASGAVHDSGHEPAPTVHSGVHETAVNGTGEHQRLELVNASGVHESAPVPVHERPARTVRETKPATASRSGRATPRTKTVPRGGRRRRFEDFLAEARTALEADPDAVITPAWVREVTNCSRGLSSKLAGALKTDPANAA